MPVTCHAYAYGEFQIVAALVSTLYYYLIFLSSVFFLLLMGKYVRNIEFNLYTQIFYLYYRM